MRVGAHQFDVRRGDAAGNLRRAEEGILRAAAEGIDLLVLPELWPTSFPGPDTDLEAALEDTRRCRERVGELAAEHGLLLCGSSFAQPDQGDPEKPTNRLELTDGERRLLSYDKVHLFSPTAEDESFTPGREPPATVDTRLGRASGLICYDLRFPEITRLPFQGGAEIVCVPAQWPATRAQHFTTLAVALAVLDQCYVVAANRTGRDVIGRRELELEFPGNSLVVDPHGHILVEGHGEQGLVAAEIDLAVVREMRRRVPVKRDQRPDLYGRWSGDREALADGSRPTDRP